MTGSSAPGASLSDADKIELKKLNEEISTLSDRLFDKTSRRNQGWGLRHFR